MPYTHQANTTCDIPSRATFIHALHHWDSPLLGSRLQGALLSYKQINIVSNLFAPAHGYRYHTANLMQQDNDYISVNKIRGHQTMLTLTKERAVNFNSDKLPMSDVLFFVFKRCRYDESRERFTIITVVLRYLHNIICPLYIHWPGGNLK